MESRILLQVDFSGGKTGHRSKHPQGKTEQVVKAAALPKRRAAASASASPAATDEHRQSSPSTQSPASPPPTSDNDSDENDEVATSLPLLWDLTAGLGTDSFLLAQAGWRVEMFERSPVVAALVQVRIVLYVAIFCRSQASHGGENVLNRRGDMPNTFHLHYLCWLRCWIRVCAGRLVKYGIPAK